MLVFFFLPRHNSRSDHHFNNDPGVIAGNPHDLDEQLAPSRLTFLSDVGGFGGELVPLKVRFWD